MAFSLGLRGVGEPRSLALTDHFPQYPLSPGCATSKWYSASWRCRCPQFGERPGSPRAGEGAGLRKSLRVPIQRKRSRWGRERSPWDQGASLGGPALALGVPPSGPQLDTPALRWIQASRSGFPDWSWRQWREGLPGRWSRHSAGRSPGLQLCRAPPLPGTPCFPVSGPDSNPHPNSDAQSSWGSRGRPPAGHNVPRPRARRSPGSRSGFRASAVPRPRCSAGRKSAERGRGERFIHSFTHSFIQ